MCHLTFLLIEKVKQMGNEKQDIGNSILKVIKGDIIDNPKFQRSVDDLTPEAIKDFYKLDSILREFFGADVDELEQKFLKNIVNIEKSKQSHSNWVQIKDPELSKILLESFADSDKMLIIGSVMNESLIISDITKKCQIPQTSGYRKINSLINTPSIIFQTPLSLQPLSSIQTQLTADT